MHASFLLFYLGKSRIENLYHNRAAIVSRIITETSFQNQNLECLIVFLFLFQLIDFILREETLQNVIKSVTRNVRSIIFTFILAVILVYFFSIVGFMFLQGNHLLSSNSPPCSNCPDHFQMISSSTPAPSSRPATATRRRCVRQWWSTRR